MEETSQALVSVPEHPLDKLQTTTKQFYQFHGVQMIGSEFPQHLVETLHLKLTDQAYDGGQFFEIVQNQQLQSFQVRAKTHIPAKGNVFLIDHALTFRYTQLRSILKQNPSILDRLEYMLKYQGDKEQPGEEIQQISQEEGLELEFDNMQLFDISALQMPKDLITLSLVSNHLQSSQELISKLQYLNLRILWLNDNPVADNQVFQQYVNNKTRIEMFNSKFTRHCTEWGLKYSQFKNVSAAAHTQNSKVYVLDLDDRNIFNIDPYLFQQFANLRSISIKGHQPTNQKQMKIIFDLFKIPSLEYIYVDEGLQKQLREAADKEQIPLSAFTKILINKHSFQRPLEEGDQRLDKIYSNIFKLAGNYRLASTEQLDESSCWYINDELGSCVPHGDTPNVKLIPFLYAPNNKLDQKVVAYTLMWPLQEIQEGDFITRDYLNGIKQQKQRSFRLAAWYKIPQQKYQPLITVHNHKMMQLCADSASFLQKFYTLNAQKQKERISKIVYQDKWTVLSDYQFINKYLKNESFDFVTEVQKADILWITIALEEEDWQKYRGKHVINQFPYQSCVVMKHNLAHCVQTVLGDTKFLMRTYDLQKELGLFIGDFKQRQKEGVDNLWILKPPNMARSLDMIITDNLSLIIRAMETGPKIAQKYITKPVLRKGNKVDLRYILLVKSISPLMLYLYKNFWIRSANNKYTVDRRHLSTYQTQFTVMNYGQVSDFKQIKYQDFIQEFQSDYKTNWSVINEKIKKMLRNTFISVATKYPQMHDDKSRAVYGIDIMIDSETMEPKLLEVTFSPDCKRACEYYPTFYDEVFETLYLEGLSENMQRII